MPHQGCLIARDLVISCMDLRTQSPLERLIKSLNLDKGQYDLVMVPGGAGDFAQLKRCARISHRLHETREVVLVIHEDCGAGAKKGDLLRAAKTALKLGLQYRAFYLFREEDGWVWEEVFFSEEELLPSWKRWWLKIISPLAGQKPVFEEE